METRSVPVTPGTALRSMIELTVEPSVPAAVGVVCARGVDATIRPDSLESAVEDLVSRRKASLDAADEAARLAARDMLRHGRYKPTGRGKPASEYLLRAAAEGSFPRINAPVDVCNVVSLRTMLPISVWDVDRAGSERYVVRHGTEGESYVFNTAGQTIDLADLLLCACRTEEAPSGIPFANPVKDSMSTKTREATTYVCAVIYAPVVGFEARLEAAVDRFAELIRVCGPSVRVTTATAAPGESVEV